MTTNRRNEVCKEIRHLLSQAADLSAKMWTDDDSYDLVMARNFLLALNSRHKKEASDDAS
jgi:hypothetical protein